MTIVNLTSTSFNLEWTKLYSVVNQYAKFYIVERKSAQGRLLALKTVPAQSTLVKSLRPSTKYRVSVFGIDSVGQPYKSFESVITTKEGKRTKSLLLISDYLSRSERFSVYVKTTNKSR